MIYYLTTKKYTKLDISHVLNNCLKNMNVELMKKDTLLLENTGHFMSDYCYCVEILQNGSKPEFVRQVLKTLKKYIEQDDMHQNKIFTDETSLLHYIKNNNSASLYCETIPFVGNDATNNDGGENPITNPWGHGKYFIKENNI